MQIFVKFITTVEIIYAAVMYCGLQIKLNTITSLDLK